MPGPPPPPPPPMGGGAPGGGEGGRGQLLGAIHRGVALKKTVTNDRSAPITGNKPTAGNAGAAAARGPLRPANNNNSNNNGGASGGGGGPPLAGLFAGGMPMLKPTNRAPATDAPPSRGWTPPPAASGGRGAGSNGATPGKRPFPSDVKNRGPPPQPPPAAFKPTMPGDAGGRKSRNAELKREMSASRIVQQGIGRLTNKPERTDGPGRLPAAKISQLERKLEGNPEPRPKVKISSMKDNRLSDGFELPPPPSPGPYDSGGGAKGGDVAKAKKRLSVSLVEPAKPETVVTRNNVSNIKRQLSRHGIEDTSTSEGRLSGPGGGAPRKPHLAPRPPSDPPAGRKEVHRAQSLRAPRSPPAVANAPPPHFQSNSIGQQHATSTSGLHQPAAPAPDFRTLPSKGRPRPPTSRPPPPPSRPPPPPTHAPPPPPPHRTPPAAPAATATNGQQRLQPAPPPTPARNSSMRGADAFERNFTWRGAHEFPRPPPFLARPKVFNSVSVRLAGGGGKAQAPQPPVLQLGSKMFQRDTSKC